LLPTVESTGGGSTPLFRAASISLNSGMALTQILIRAWQVSYFRLCVTTLSAMIRVAWFAQDERPFRIFGIAGFVASDKR